MSRETQADNRRNGGGPADRAMFMMTDMELMTPNTTWDEKMRGYTVGPNAPCGTPPQTYTVGSRGQEDVRIGDDPV